MLVAIPPQSGDPLAGAARLIIHGRARLVSRGSAEYSAHASQLFRAIAANVWTLPGRGMSVDSGASPSGTAGTTNIRQRERKSWT